MLALAVTPAAFAPGCPTSSPARANARPHGACRCGTSCRRHRRHQGVTHETHPLEESNRGRAGGPRRRGDCVRGHDDVDAGAGDGGRAGGNHDDDRRSGFAACRGTDYGRGAGSGDAAVGRGSDVRARSARTGCSVAVDARACCVLECEAGEAEGHEAARSGRGELWRRFVRGEEIGASVRDQNAEVDRARRSRTSFVRPARSRDFLVTRAPRGPY